MADTPQGEVSSPFAVYDTKDIRPNPPAGELAMREVTNTTTGATIASGFLVVRDMVLPPFTPWYDSVLLLHACEGELELEQDGARRKLQVGDVAWIRSGSAVAFHARGGAATLFYAVTPADWRFRAPDPSFPTS